MGWPTYSGIVSVFVVLYFASIGPLAWLEINGYGNRVFWQRLHVAYTPIYQTWLHGPDSCGRWIKNYLGLFGRHHTRHGPFLFASPNEVEAERFLYALDSVEWTSLPFESAPLTSPTKWKDLKARISSRDKKKQQNGRR